MERGRNPDWDSVCVATMATVCGRACPAYAICVANQNCTCDLRGKLYASCAKLHTMDVPYGGFSGATRPHVTLRQGDYRIGG